MQQRSFAPEKVELLEKFYPSVRKGPKDQGEPQRFEIAIMLAGAISAGAYTAGVMDFLIEALDTWYARKAQDRKSGEHTVPQHEVVLRLITGASAGGMNGAIAAASLHYSFPHVRGSTPKAKRAGNPFYSAWVESIDIQEMLHCGDLGSGVPASLLNCDILKEIAEQIVSFKAAPAEPEMRAWLLNPYEVRLTVTNLRGVPFAYNLRTLDPAQHEGFLMHGDHMAFAVEHAGCGPAEGSRPDCTILREALPRSDATWQGLAGAALATGAFPAALQARDLSRNPDEYLWRYSFYDVEWREPVFANPIWAGLLNPYEFANVDGGVINNEPFELARGALAGPRGQNAQSGASADRAVIVIDPFVEDPDPGPGSKAGMLAAALGMFGSLKNQARMSMQDLVQAQRDDVYSRYLIAPSRDVTTGDGRKQTVFGQGALATSGLGAFIGFFCEGYREHDFLLGRRNAQKFLRDVFTLPNDNTLFDGGRWTVENTKTFGAGDGSGELQIIPLCGAAAEPEPLPPWPTGAYRDSQAQIAEAVRARTKAMGRTLASALATLCAGRGHGFWIRLWRSFLRLCFRGIFALVGWWAAGRVIGVINNGFLGVDARA